jgi:hypothetical protein
MPVAFYRLLPHRAIGSDPPGDVFIASRIAEFVGFADGWRQVYRWLLGHVHPTHQITTSPGSLRRRVIDAMRKGGTPDAAASRLAEAAVAARLVGGRPS